MDSKSISNQLAQDSTSMREYQQNKESREVRKEAGRRLVEKFMKNGLPRHQAETKAREMNYIV